MIKSLNKRVGAAVWEGELGCCNHLLDYRRQMLCLRVSSYAHRNISLRATPHRDLFALKQTFSGNTSLKSAVGVSLTALFYPFILTKFPNSTLMVSKSLSL